MKKSYVPCPQCGFGRTRHAPNSQRACPKCKHHWDWTPEDP